MIVLINSDDQQEHITSQGVEKGWSPGKTGQRQRINNVAKRRRGYRIKRLVLKEIIG